MVINADPAETPTPGETFGAAPALAPQVAAIRLDGSGRISDASVSAAAMLGLEPQALRGRSLKELALEGWQAAAEVATARVRFGATESFELALKGRSGRRTLVEMTARSAGDNEGALIAWSERRARRAAASEKQTEQQRLAYSLLRAQEAERLRVASELHDEIAPVVVMVKYMVEDAIGRFGAEVPAESLRMLSDATQRLRGVLTELRRICNELRPRVLDDLGLLPALEWLSRGVEDSVRGLRVECRLGVAEPEIPEALKLDIFRVAQAALGNVVEHAKATHAVVALISANGELCILVEDDGTGFDPHAAGAEREGGAGLGLQSIRKRIEATGGRFLFESQGQRGTSVGGAWRLEDFNARR